MMIKNKVYLLGTVVEGPHKREYEHQNSCRLLLQFADSHLGGSYILVYALGEVARTMEPLIFGDLIYVVGCLRPNPGDGSIQICPSEIVFVKKMGEVRLQYLRKGLAKHRQFLRGELSPPEAPVEADGKPAGYSHSVAQR